MGNRQVVERYARALGEHDADAMDAVRHEDYEGRYPQSGEVVRGRAKARALEEAFSSAAEGPDTVILDRIVGADDQFIPGPSWNIIHLSGSGDDFTMAGTITYRNGETWHAVALLTFREGKIWREVGYFAAPFERPDWRVPFTELETQG
ncbi:MAG TPA: nuclear transport factor 2 family protein [Candidatus Limnocylindria bacterium]|jgi:ketosteroid isomerase-like protein|nr:nuclear transport factor 2 family protein [Candidatus Limnocylindria bacterium]